MQVAIINDTHCGVKNGSDVFLKNAEKFYTDVFFPYLKENNIDSIIHLGDYFEHRKFVNFKALNQNKRVFLDILRERGIHMTIIPGNHDVYYKNTNQLNSLTECLSEYNDCVTIYQEPIDLKVGNTTIGMVPWICPENEDKCLEFLENTKSQIIMGHFELGGFRYMANANIKSHGMDKSKLKRFEAVYSGHYHTKSTQDNVTYLGTQLELTWSDAGDPKFFHIFDTNTREMTPVRNPHTLFEKITYDEENPIQLREEMIVGKYIKIIVTSKKDLFSFDKFLEKVYNFNPHEVKIIETFEEYAGDSVDDEKISTADTQTLLNEYVDATETNLDNDKLKKMLQELYVEAQAYDSI
jgi:DNA repair exonuclease SbcCD nuclease subunit